MARAGADGGVLVGGDQLVNAYADFAADDDGPYDDQFELGNDHHLVDEYQAHEPEPCIYFDQPGHTPDQKPDPRVYGRGFDQLPMCTNCDLRAREAAE